MGIFGSRYKTQVGTSIMRVMEDAVLPNSIITGVIRSQQESDNQMIENANEELISGLGLRVHNLYNYAEKHYIHGLPSGTSMTNLLGRNTILQAIEIETNTDIGLDYYHVGPLNLLHLGWHLLVKNHNYDSRDNSLTYDSKKVYLTDMQPVVVEATVAELESGAMDTWGISPASGITPLRKVSGVEGHEVDRPVFVVDAAAPADYILVKYCFEEDYIKVVEGVNIPSKRVVEANFQMSVAAFDAGASYHQAGYNDGARKGYWLYQIGSNSNPAIEAIFQTGATDGGTFFPMIYFRFDKQAITKANIAYKTSDRLLSKINMKFEDVSEGINENPDIKDVEQAFMTFAVPADTKEEIEQRYLFDFFNNLWRGNQLAPAPAVQSVSDIRSKLFAEFVEPQGSQTIVIQDRKFKMALTWHNIIKRRVTGNVAAKKKYHSEKVEKGQTVRAVNVFGVEVNVPIPQSAFVYQHQITENVYEEIQVFGLKMTYYVWGDYTTAGDEFNDDILLIPLDYDITKNYTIKDRELLYARSMHYVFNSRIVTKLKWYQTGIFKAILVIVAIVITVYNIYLGLKALAAALTVQAAIKMIAVFLIKYAVVNLGIKLFVKLVGVKFAFIVAIIAAVVSLQGLDFSFAQGVTGAPWASQLLQVSSGLTSAINKELKEDFADLNNDFKSFEDYAKEQNEKLDAAKALLTNTHHLVPMVIWGETPDNFYQRTVHSGNIGIVGLDAISSYVDVALTLPKLTDTLGDLYV